MLAPGPVFRRGAYAVGSFDHWFIRHWAYTSLEPALHQCGLGKLSIFLTFLVPKLLAPKEEDLSKGIFELTNQDYPGKAAER